jgi:hypothetical protein
MTNGNPLERVEITLRFHPPRIASTTPPRLSQRRDFPKGSASEKENEKSCGISNV